MLLLKIPNQLLKRKKIDIFASHIKSLMKKHLLALALIGSAVLVNGQNSAITSAFAHLGDYNSGKDTADLIEAKTYIDQAAANEKTANEPKMFLRRGDIYIALFESRVNTVQTRIIKNDPKTSPRDAKNMAYSQADSGLLGTATRSYMKVIELDPKGDYVDDAKTGIGRCTNNMIYKAVGDNISKNYASSFTFFERVHLLEKAQGAADSGALYKQMLQYSASTAELSKNYPKAITYYKEMTTIKSGSYSFGDAPYTALYRLYINQNDSADAMTAAQQGHVAIPDNINLLNLVTNGYLWKNQYDKAITSLQATIDQVKAKKPHTASDDTLESRLYAIMAQAYDNEANPRDANHQLAPEPANYLDLFQKADTNYKMAISLNKDFYDAIFALAAMYNNRVAVIYKKMNEETDKNPKANTKAEEDLAKKLLLQAEPYFETAYKLKPDKQTKNALDVLYENTGQTDKKKALDAQ